MTRVLVFEDSVYRVDCTGTYTDQAFLALLGPLADAGCELTVLGRLADVPGRSHYRLPPSVRFVPLPYYGSLGSPSSLLGLLRAVRRASRETGRADVAWLMGPHPLSVLLALLATWQGTRVVLGVRQDLPEYTRRRHPGRPLLHRAADLLERCWLLLARRRGVVAVGPQLVARYAHAHALLPLAVSLVPRAEVARPDAARAGASGGEDCLRVLSVGRIDPEKNPLLLADVLALLRRQDPRWRLVVCGDGTLLPELRVRLRQLGVEDAAELRGYVPVDAGLLDVYRSCDVFLHVSWTEGLPQVLVEAWAAGVPVVATDVGGVREAAGDAARLIPPGDASAAAAAVLDLHRDRRSADRLVSAGRRRVAGSTREDVVSALSDFLRQPEPHAVPCPVDA